MTYDFKTLSPADFEDLARDLVGAEFDIRLEGFGPGPDGGVDGRHAVGGANTVLQAKHKAGSRFSSLQSVMKKERKSIDRLEPERYILATSQSLTPHKKDQLAEIIGPALKDTGDILGCTELNAILRRHPEIERAHIKLWLSSAAVLDRFLRSAAFAYTATSRQEILDKLRVYAPNPSFAISRNILEKHHVLIVSGPPGVGKTTLAQMLVYAYIGEEWEFIAIQNLDDGFAKIEDVKKQIFFFDDFLGKIALDRSALAAKDSELVRFIRRVQRSKNARFILTTRAYIYEEARNVSESIGDPRLDISKYVLDVGIYTRRVRARILYNHLVVSALPPKYIRALIAGDALPNIVDHEHYNPRIIEWMTDASYLKDVPPKAYVDRFINALDHPTEIWDRAFREHIPPKAQHLLICLFFCSEYGEELDVLRSEFEAVHARLCAKHHLSSAPTDFEDSLKLLEGSFLVLRNRKALFVNPSVRDYLNQYLNDVTLLADLAPTAQSVDWARAVWRHYKTLKPPVSILPSAFAALFIHIGSRFKDIPTWRASANQPRVRTPHDLALTDRCRLLAEWYAATNKVAFADALQALVSNPPDSFSPWRDGPDLPELIAEFRSGYSEGIPGADEIANQLEKHLVEILRGGVDSDDIDRIREAVVRFCDDLAEEVPNALTNTIKYEIDEAARLVSEYDSESVLEDHAENIKKMAAWAGIDPSTALSSIEDRLQEIREEEFRSEEPAFPTGPSKERDKFDDAALKSMFATLARR